MLLVATSCPAVARRHITCWFSRRALPEPQPRLRDKIEAAVADRAVRLVKIHAALTGDRAALADVATGRGLAELDPREVLQRRWARDHDAPVPAEVARAFDELLEQARSAP